jgi:hypothetical protein
MEKYRKAILGKLYRHRYIGGRHTSIDNVPKGFPKNETRNIEKALKSLVKEDYILQKPTSYGTEICLNPRKIKEIRKIIDPSDD